MTADALADLLHARRTGPGRWMARCPAHNDREPSLSIREGRDGRALINCFAGCALPSILSSAGLQLRDLFAGPPHTPKEAEEAARQRAQRDAAGAAERQAERVLADRYRKLGAVCDALAATLARTPDDAPDGNALTKLYHDALARLRVTEEAFEIREASRFHGRLMQFRRTHRLEAA